MKERDHNFFLLLSLSGFKTRGSEFFLQRFKLNIRKNFLLVRAVRQYNKLPKEIAESPSLEVHEGAG